MLRPYKGSESGRQREALANACRVAAIAHMRRRGRRIRGVEQAKHAALALAPGEGSEFKQRASGGDPEVVCIRSGVRVAVADIFVGEEFDFLKPTTGADETSP